MQYSVQHHPKGTFERLSVNGGFILLFLVKSCECELHKSRLLQEPRRDKLWLHKDFLAFCGHDNMPD